MAARRMFIVAGPPGAGKSSVFSLSGFANRVFNADDRAAEHANIRAVTSFAIETTLRSTITFDQRADVLK